MNIFFKFKIIGFIIPVASAFLLFSDPAIALCVKEDKANLRKGPGTKYKKLWQVFRYMPFEKVGQKNSWYKVKDLDGDTYWIHKKLVTSRYKCAVVKKEKANFREGPDTKFAMVSWSPMPRYFSMKVLKRSKKWLKVQDETGDVAWVYRPLVWVK